jgi:hypothetical protein
MTRTAVAPLVVVYVCPLLTCTGETLEPSTTNCCAWAGQAATAAAAAATAPTRHVLRQTRENGFVICVTFKRKGGQWKECVQARVKKVTGWNKQYR